MRYFLVDRIDPEVTPDAIRGWKVAAASEDVFEHHFPERAVVPGNLVLEACAQLALWHEIWASRGERVFQMDGVTSARWTRFAVPGDRIELRLTRQEAPDGRRTWEAACRIEEAPSAQLAFTGRVEPLTTWMDPAQALARLDELGGGRLPPHGEPS
jgi:3-hydroxyacyl-[acyl-carrier-protein] dehydratase